MEVTKIDLWENICGVLKRSAGGRWKWKEAKKNEQVRNRRKYKRNKYKLKEETGSAQHIYFYSEVSAYLKTEICLKYEKIFESL